jgi:phage terminase large subunit GpA-like protein
MVLLDDVERRARRAFIPPPKLSLSSWIENFLRLPADVSALAGPVELFPFTREIADCMSDSEHERVTLVKATRLGFTTLLVGCLGAFIQNDPAPILLILPTADDTRDMVTTVLEPIFAATPALRDALQAEADEVNRSTMMSRKFKGGFLKIIPARAPRNLRKHTARVVLMDEVDAFEVTEEGSPINLAEQRSISYPNRKIITGSTPIYAETSAILKRYEESDKRVYECPCPHCGAFTELLWEHIRWPENQPENAQFCCPSCGVFADERDKFSMVHAGHWRITRPGVQSHAGFRLNALVSLLPNVSWGKLATEFVKAKENPADLQVFVNCSLAQGWTEAGAEIDDTALASRAEAFSFEAMPRELRLITAGVDVQDDRLECTLVGWNKEGSLFVLRHDVLWGSPADKLTWQELASLLETRWRHPSGGLIGVTAACIDSGDGDWTPAVYAFAFPRASRRTMATKGMAGSRPVIEASRGKMQGGGRLWVVGVDVVKTRLFDQFQRNTGLHFSNSLPPVFYEQLASERRVSRYFRGRPIRRFELISGRRNEALDCLVLAVAAHATLRPNFAHIEARLAGVEPVRPSIASLLPH